MTDYGLVSIITPNYNCARFIAQTIDSVLGQTYQNWELLIQDDCSTDDSMTIAMQYAERDSRIKVQQNSKNSGAAITRNNAIKRSKGKWLAFLDSDDLWLPEKMEKQLRFMNEQNCDFSFTEYEHITEEGERMGVVAKTVKSLSYNRLLTHCWPGCLTVMYKQDVNNKVYCQDVKKNNDHALFLQALKGRKAGKGFPVCTALYRIRRGSISRNKCKMIQPYIKVVHDLEGKNIFLSFFFVFTHTITKFFFKYKKAQTARRYIDTI